jgi:hypothetical protein
MKNIAIIILAWLVFTTSNGQSWDWALHVPATHGAHMDEDTAGNIYTAQGMGANPDAWELTKRDATGNILWTRSLSAMVQALKVGQQRIVIGGTFAGTVTFEGITLTSTDANDGFLACYDLAGTLQWVRHVAGINNNAVTSLDMNGAGAVFASVSNDSSAVMESAVFARGVAIAVLSSEGVLTDEFEINGRVFSSEISVDQYDNIYLVGGYNQPVISVGGIMLTCSDTYYGAYFLARLQRNGVAHWARDAGSKFRRELSNLRCNAGNLYYTESNTYLEGTLIKLRPDGKLIWNKTIGSAIYGSVYDMRLDANEDIYFSGILWNEGNFSACTVQGTEYFLYVTKMDSAGNCRWSISGQGKGRAAATDLSIKNNHVMVLGWSLTNEPVQLGPISVNGQFFLGRIAEASTGIAMNSLAENKLAVYPNPSGGAFTIRVSRPFSRVSVYNMLGEKIYAANGSEAIQHIDLGEHPGQILLLRVEGAWGSAEQRIMTKP